MHELEAQVLHDLRNTALVLREAAVSLHEHRATMPPEVVDRMCEMLSRRGDMLVRQLEDLSTAHLVDGGQLDLALGPVSLARACAQVVTERTDHRTRVTLDVPEDLDVLADATRVVQVLDNLLSNARRYGGPAVQVRALRCGGAVALEVSDDGPGVPADLRETLFDAYARGTSSSSLGGSGLGLLISRQLCEAMGGALTYDADRGSRFTATFPAVPRATDDLGPDDAGAAGHAVGFWTDERNLARRLTTYVAHGLARGEGVLVAATSAHHDLLVDGLAALGIDAGAATASGQLVALDAARLRLSLEVDGRIDRGAFEDLVGATVADLTRRWRSVRAYGEIVDLFRARGADHLAVELEAAWNRLRARRPFPLLCTYELGPDAGAAHLCESHDAVVAA